ncbi:hypothetical protein GE09DRAFT_1097776 [Coniochaeta sp. 2T2.1]|nr:hypothetical protein GE09DRAFT_1097776 [Coniochaeta sp. 2T2.1]
MVFLYPLLAMYITCSRLITNGLGAWRLRSGDICFVFYLGFKYSRHKQSYNLPFTTPASIPVAVWTIASFINSGPDTLRSSGP